MAERCRVPLALALLALFVFVSFSQNAIAISGCPTVSNEVIQ